MFWKSSRLEGLEGKINGALGVDTALSGELKSIPIYSEVLTVCLAMERKHRIGTLAQHKALTTV